MAPGHSEAILLKKGSGCWGLLASFLGSFLKMLALRFCFFFMRLPGERKGRTKCDNVLMLSVFWTTFGHILDYIWTL